MESEGLVSVAKLLLPEVLVEYFELTEHQIVGEELHFHFREKNVVPSGFSGEKLSSKGFFDTAKVQDFPIRGKHVYLYITRRRWLNESSGKVVSRNWDLVAKGTRMTNDFATFLKEISRY
ncbi:MAG: transposase [Candidatus Omnitrophica bacterium]|nr:transposase [Candidatus Omnitrophota bacterium]